MESFKAALSDIDYDAVIAEKGKTYLLE
jgi:hypothetical protein